MNWLVIIAVLILIWRVAEGIHRGMVKEIISFVSLIVLCLAVALLGMALSKYFEKDIASMIVALILLLVLCIVHRLLSLVFFSAKMIAKLPVIHSLDKILGAAIGVLETILLVWTMYSLIITFGMGMVGTQIMHYASENQILRFLYNHNYLQHLVELLAQKMSLAGITF
ncbi:MAG: CvpA family protein [Lachnospiraceae bacterium]|nr:CvpA family protein [Lachnospiraceae bacterium]